VGILQGHLLETGTITDNERGYLEALRTVLMDLDEETINQMIPMAGGILDTTGIDGIWDQILDKAGKGVVEFARAPQSYWMMDTAIADGFISEMCTKLVQQYVPGWQPERIRSVVIPEEAWSQSSDVLRLLQSVQCVLENL
jgi:hypothetical protein